MTSSGKLVPTSQTVTEGGIIDASDKWDAPKNEWGDGPWQHEPDEHEFTYRGFRCVILRSHSGALCGYIVIPTDHPWAGLRPETDDTERITCHGGVTWSEPNLPSSKKDLGWVIGFDCAHAYDYMPAYEALMKKVIAPERWRPEGFLYKNMNFVTEELLKLAEQAASAR